MRLSVAVALTLAVTPALPAEDANFKNAVGLALYEAACGETPRSRSLLEKTIAAYANEKGIEPGTAMTNVLASASSMKSVVATDEKRTAFCAKVGENIANFDKIVGLPQSQTLIQRYITGRYNQFVEIAIPFGIGSSLAYGFSVVRRRQAGKAVEAPGRIVGWGIICAIAAHLLMAS